MAPSDDTETWLREAVGDELVDALEALVEYYNQRPRLEPWEAAAGDYYDYDRAVSAWEEGLDAVVQAVVNAY